MKKKNEFGRYNKVFPLHKITGWKPFAKNYRLAVGISEIICGSIMVLVPGPAKNLACLILLGIMMGSWYTHYMLKDKFERQVPSIVFSLMLICRLIISYQVNRRERKNEEKLRSATASATEEKKEN